MSRITIHHNLFGSIFLRKGELICENDIGPNMIFYLNHGLSRSGSLIIIKKSKVALRDVLLSNKKLFLELNNLITNIFDGRIVSFIICFSKILERDIHEQRFCRSRRIADWRLNIF